MLVKANKYAMISNFLSNTPLLYYSFEMEMLQTFLSLWYEEANFYSIFRFMFLLVKDVKRDDRNKYFERVAHCIAPGLKVINERCGKAELEGNEISELFLLIEKSGLVRPTRLL